jgi:YtxH-like protein
VKKKLSDREIILLEPESPSGLKWLMIGAALGAGLALLLAPASGEETRRQLGRRARKIRQAAENAIDELHERFDSLRGSAEHDEEEAEEDEPADEGGAERGAGPAPVPTADAAAERSASLSSARAELERRLAAARARRGEPAVEDEEPVA